MSYSKYRKISTYFINIFHPYIRCKLLIKSNYSIMLSRIKYRVVINRKKVPKSSGMEMMQWQGIGSIVIAVFCWFWFLTNTHKDTHTHTLTNTDTQTHINTHSLYIYIDKYLSNIWNSNVLAIKFDE